MDDQTTSPPNESAVPDDQPVLSPQHSSPSPATASAAPHQTPELDHQATAAAASAAVLKAGKVVEEFQYLLEKSQQLFAGLRDLPPTGSNRQWQPYFQRTFEVYTKLWKFQQSNRIILEDKTNYGLKRWEVGEIASKIGQLYYHYYLRTSETNYLREAHIFYEAIRERQYFKDILDNKNPALVIKKMRYYARFIVVCLLLNNNDIVRTLTEELESLVDEYVRTFRPIDAADWQLVLKEIQTFMEAEKKLVPLDHDAGNQPVPVVHRLQIERTPRQDKDGSSKLRLQEAILVGNNQNQIKFSELTLDMYRMLQSLEREPPSLKDAGDSLIPPDVSEDPSVSSTSAGAGSDKSSKRANPHKYLLYRPTFSQLMVYISTAFKDINDNSAMLLYLSADGLTISGNEVVEPVEYFRVRIFMSISTILLGYSGGVLTNQRKPNDKGEPSDRGRVNCLCPSDLMPFTRRPLFLIVDSNNSVAFKYVNEEIQLIALTLDYTFYSSLQNFPKVFNQPLLCLLSPTEYPPSIQDVIEIGSLFTLFLHAPLLGFCFISDIAELHHETWEQCVALMERAEIRVAEIFSDIETGKHSPELYYNRPCGDSGNIGAWLSIYRYLRRFLQDDFLRQFIVRFVICYVIMRSHTQFKDEKSFPSSYPALPQEVLSSTEIADLMRDLTDLANVSSYYSFSI
ncbi:protein SCAI [Endogone sp. FLAS-F59071]|nr:protein SCAI [Endogone sp. FLAS-F59071]|eukprot:RUS15213.1 protein SCAI [Endogone sp. FLAS-F59071]